MSNEIPNRTIIIQIGTELNSGTHEDGERYTVKEVIEAEVVNCVDNALVVRVKGDPNQYYYHQPELPQQGTK